MAASPAVAALIREVLAEELARLRPGVRVERVRIADDTDLAAFAKRVLAVADDREVREAFEKGALVFRLDAGAGGTGSTAGGGAGSGGGGSGSVRAGRGGGPASPPGMASVRGPAGGTEAIERGLLSERLVDRLPRETARVRIGRGVRMTPLARDRLRRRGIAVERAD